MKIRPPWAVFSLFYCIIISFAVAAPNSLWTEGKDRPNDRVNADAKVVTPDAYQKISQRVDGAVVNISTSKIVKGNDMRGHPPIFGHPRMPDKNSPPSPFDDFFDQFFQGPGQPDRDRREQSLGSGFVIRSDGYVVTNNHVVEKADEIKVILSDESEYVAKVVGRDPRTDVALLKIESKKTLATVVLGDSDRVKVGEIVVAIGNPFGLSHTVTQGIVSAKERPIGFDSYDDFIQTDASINPGNSGGPLLNFQGEVVGINAAIIASGQGIGFAIPINLAKGILLQLKDKGKVVRGWLGVVIQKVTEDHAKALGLKERTGALVAEVQKDSPAAKAGMLAGDVVTKFDGKEIHEWRNLPISVANTPVGKSVVLEIIRDGKSKTISLTVGELKEKEVAKISEDEEKNDALGLAVETLTPEAARSLGLEPKSEGVLVRDVDEGGAAAEKGIKKGDVIVEVNRKKISSALTYSQIVSKLKKGDSVLLLVKRGEGTLFVAFSL